MYTSATEILCGENPWGDLAIYALAWRSTYMYFNMFSLTLSYSGFHNTTMSSLNQGPYH